MRWMTWRVAPAWRYEAGSVTAALGTKWAHCVNTRLVLEAGAYTRPLFSST